MGKTKNIDHRMANYNTGNANNLEPLFILEVDDIDRVEDCIKNLVKQYQYRQYKEVYQIDIDLLKRACIECDELINGFEKYAKKMKSEEEFSQKMEYLSNTRKPISIKIER
jgi:hypothetical protein